MQLNEKTLQVLKNFAGINSNIVIDEGNTVKTISEARNIVASAIVEESFPNVFGIYDLNEFLNVLGLVESPNLKFDQDYITVSDSIGRSSVKYFVSDTNILTSPPAGVIDKLSKASEAEVTFSLDNTTLNRIKRAASALGHSVLAISPADGAIRLSVVDSDNETSNVYSIDVDGEYGNEDFNFIINIESLKLIPGDYRVKLSSQLISEFVNPENNVTYWIALEKSSKYGE